MRTSVFQQLKWAGDTWEVRRGHFKHGSCDFNKHTKVTVNLCDPRYRMCFLAALPDPAARPRRLHGYLGDVSFVPSSTGPFCYAKRVLPCCRGQMASSQPTAPPTLHSGCETIKDSRFSLPLLSGYYSVRDRRDYLGIIIFLPFAPWLKCHPRSIVFLISTPKLLHPPWHKLSFKEVVITLSRTHALSSFETQATK